MNRIPNQPPVPHPRAGLAPLELVLNLPIMLFVMGLIVVFGTAGSWKIRTLANSRQAAWREFWPRTGNTDARPDGWPAGAEMRSTAGSPAVMPDDPWAGFPVVRGPMLVDDGTGLALPVKDQTLDMTEGLRHGFAHIRRPFPLLSKMPPHEIDFTRETAVLDGSRWQFHTMGIASNLTRRILFLYPLDLQGRVDHLIQAFFEAALAILQNPNRPELVPLEGGDPEIRQLLGIETPDFQPAIPLGFERSTIDALEGRILRPTVCESDAALVRQRYLDDRGRLKDQIRRVPRTMAQRYIDWYQQKIRQLEAQMPQPPGAQALIQELQQKIDQLREFQSSLPP